MSAGEERFQQALEALLAALPPGLDEARRAIEELAREDQRLRRRLDKISRISDGYQARLLELNRELRESNGRLTAALAEVKTLRGFIPICSHCKRIRDDQGYWDRLESYLSRHSEALFSHGICPQCAHEHYPEIFPTPPDAPPAESPAAPREATEDEVLAGRLDALRADPSHRGHPLMAELETLAHRHGRLVRRLEKITRISDGFQRQMKELNTSLQEACRTDPLTGLSNRRDMLDRLEGELGRVARTGAPVAVLMIDVDHFKAVNDTYGHEVGDLVLQTLAMRLTDSLRVYDSCARWGGEEFLVLLPEADQAGTLAVAEKIRAEAVCPFPGATFPCPAPTVSVGAALRWPGETLHSLLRRADEAMYEAKRQGRDRVVLAPAPD